MAGAVLERAEEDPISVCLQGSCPPWLDHVRHESRTGAHYSFAPLEVSGRDRSISSVRLGSKGSAHMPAHSRIGLAGQASKLGPGQKGAPSRCVVVRSPEHDRLAP